MVCKMEPIRRSFTGRLTKTLLFPARTLLLFVLLILRLGFKMEDEENLNRYRFSQKETIEMGVRERLYTRMLPSLSLYVVALFKVLLAATPSNQVITLPIP